MEETLEDNKALLVVALLEEWDHPLILAEKSISSISIAESADNWAICVVEYVKAEEEKCLFPKSLLSTTMQDGGIRERRDKKSHFTA